MASCTSNHNCSKKSTLDGNQPPSQRAAPAREQDLKSGRQLEVRQGQGREHCQHSIGSEVASSPLFDDFARLFPHFLAPSKSRGLAGSSAASNRSSSRDFRTRFFPFQSSHLFLCHIHHPVALNHRQDVQEVSESVCRVTSSSTWITPNWRYHPSDSQDVRKADSWPSSFLSI